MPGCGRNSKRAIAPPRDSRSKTARDGPAWGCGEPGYAVIQSSDAAALRSRDGQFVVIEGRVRRVGFGRSRLYLDLVPRDGPTIIVARKLESTLIRAGRPVEMLAGQTIRARGALDARIGPRIEVNEPAMIEIVRPLEAQGAEKPRR
jgi:hypothetical protein